MATITPTEVNCPNETATSKKAYLRLTITSISDSDATTNKRYIGCKLTIQGSRWVGLYKWECTLGGQTVSSETQTVENWYTGHVLATKNLTFNNDSAGNLSLTAYIKQLFYSGSWAWTDSSKTQSVTKTLVCSQLPRYANFTNHTISAKGINYFSVYWTADANISSVQYSLDGGAYQNTSGNTYNINNLQPNSTHTIKTKIVRSDSSLSTESGTLSVTTEPLPTSNTPAAINIGNNATVSISSMSNLSYWYVTVYDGGTYLTQSSNFTSTSGTVTLSSFTSGMLSRHTSANSWNLTYNYYCVSNGVTYTLTSRTAACNIPSDSYKPTFNANNLSYEVTNSASNNITGSNQKVIKGISNVKIKMTPASPQGSSSIASYTANSGTRSSTTTSVSSNPVVINLTAVDGNSFTAQAIDTRGKSTPASKSYSTYIDYFAPYTTGISVSRVDGVTANVKITITGKYMNWSNLSVSNTITQVSVKYKLRSASTWTTLTGFNLSITASSGNFTATGTTTGDVFNISSEYDIQIALADTFNIIYSQGIIYTANVLLWKDVTNHRLGIGKKPSYTLDVNGAFNVSGNSLIGGTTTFGDKLIIQKNGNKGIYNTSDYPIIRDHGNNNVTVDATGGVLYLGYQNTTGLNILSGKITINSNGTITSASGLNLNGNINFNNGTSKQIYWKEGDYGDQFALIPAFNGTNDDNKFKVMGAVGDYGTTPSLYDLLTISGQNGNVWYKGTLNKLRTNDTNGVILTSSNDISSNPANSFQTTIFGSNNGYTRIKAVRANNGSIPGFPAWSVAIVSSVYDTHMYICADYSSSNPHAYIGGGNSDKLNWYREIAFSGVILYDNANGTNGNVTLSETAANFKYLEIYFKDNTANNEWHYEKIINPNGKNTTIGFIRNYYSNAYYVYLYSKNITINGTTITSNRNSYIQFYNKTVNVNNGDNNIYIVRVIGIR